MKRTFYGVQALRGLGAIMVVMCHAALMLHDRVDESIPYFVVGGAGVDLFFAISGFIMVVATHKTWGEPNTAWTFLKRRCIRVIPLYWIMTSVKLAQMAVGSHRDDLGWWHSIAAYLFIPAWDTANRLFPPLLPGWTMNLEMLFYGLMALCLWWRKSPLWPLTILFAIMVIVGMVILPSQAALGLWLHQCILEFVFGMWIAYAMIKGYTIPKRVAVFLAPLCLLCVLATYGSEQAFNARLLYWGVPMALLLASIVSLESLTFWQHPLFQILGNASYAIYLTHDYAISVVRVLVQKLGLMGTAAWISGGLSILVLACIVGALVYQYLEKPMLAWMHKRF